MSKVRRRAGRILLALFFPLFVGCTQEIVEKPKIDPKLLHSVQIWANKQKYLIPDEDDLHMAFKAGIQNNVDPFLLLAVIGVESSFRATAKSNAGAIGYMQVVPKWHLDKIDDVKNLTIPHHNINIGASILKEYIDRSKSLEQALQRYSGNTKNYSNKVLKVYYGLLKECGT